MSRKYTQEQGELQTRIKALKTEIDRHTDKSMTMDAFISTVRKYTRAKKLTERMLAELIDRFEVHQAQRVDGVNMQQLTIHYNCVGTIEIPDIEQLSDLDVLIPTRKGVATSYSTAKLAV